MVVIVVPSSPMPEFPKFDVEVNFGITLTVPTIDPPVAAQLHAGATAWFW
jgi:hypothetical protein